MTESNVELRRPRIGGVAGGCGTSTVAELVGAQDVGVVTAGVSVDVLVCRSVSWQLKLVQTLVDQAPTAPILVINADAPTRPPAQVRDRARLVEPNVPALLWLPWLDPLRSMSDPAAQLRDSAVADSPEKWVLGARSVRHELIDALTHLLRPAPGVEDEPVGADLLRRTS